MKRAFVAALGLLSLLFAPVAEAAASNSAVKHVRVNGISIGYRIVGSGPPLVMIPGFAFTMAEWDPRLVGALANHHRVVLFDNRGVASTTDTPHNRLTISEMASDTAGLIGALHLRRPEVLGWSMGGYIAQDLALRHPSLVRALTLASTDAGGANAIQPAPKVIKELRHASRSQLLALLFPRSKLAAAKAWEKRIGEQAARLHFPQSYFTPSARIVAQQFRAAGLGWEAPGHGSYGRLPRLRIRTLIMAGRDDVIVPPRNSLLLHARIAHSRLVRYSDAGHAFLFQDPLAVARAIRAL
jgi:pimeloyl-ACP methyl ester carboxylesterase